ncbi:unnamed protein product [Arabis nemorensis]|uniref:Uncharacterized protein n=1 Tax=Arabis nemorensis TaxID=586526 RepID=A0A565CSC8_9BRAS|nr:unnamed protein product [Arabis nemorensis]
MSDASSPLDIRSEFRVGEIRCRRCCNLTVVTRTTHAGLLDDKSKASSWPYLNEICFSISFGDFVARDECCTIERLEISREMLLMELKLCPSRLLSVPASMGELAKEDQSRIVIYSSSTTLRSTGLFAGRR